MPKEMLINVSAGEECRIAVVEDGKLEELYMERASAVSHVGNVYKGKVTNVEASIQAAFVDFGIGRNGFLHVSDLMPTYWGRKGENVKESVGRKLGRRDRPPIQQCLRRGDEIIVQVIKEGLGTKGPTLSSYLSIPGRILVMMPGVGKSGVSKKIEDEDERRRLRKILDELAPPKDAGFIIRTAGVGRSKQEIERDFKYLMRLWENIEKADTKKAPLELYAEGDLVMRTVRDVYTADIEKIVVDDKDTARRIKDFFKLLMPRTKNAVEVYEGPVPLFHEYGVERDLELMHSRTVPLKSGGSLVIDQTEAVVAIDVNSGKSRQSGDAETTAFKTDLEAADEIPRQLKLRDLGGVVICDFIDLRFERHRRELEERLAENLKKDRAKTRFLQMSEFGIIEMTRQRMRPSLKKSVFHDCPGCHGHGLVKTPESMGLDVVRRLTIAAYHDRVRRVELSLNPEVAVEVLNRKRDELAQLEHDTGKRIIIKSDAELSLDDMNFELFDEREGTLWLEVLGMEAPQGGGGGGGNQQRDQRGGGRGRRGGRDRGGRHQNGNGNGNGGREDYDARAELEADDEGEPAEIRPPREPDRPRERDDREDRGGRGEWRDRGDQSRAAHGPREDRRPVQAAPIESDEPEEELLDEAEEHDDAEAEHDTDREQGGEGGYDVSTGSYDAGYDVNAGLPAEAGDAGEPVDEAGDAEGSAEGEAEGDEGQYEGGYDTGYGSQGGGQGGGGQGGGQFRDEQGGGGRRRRRRRRGRRGRGGQGGDQPFAQQGGGGGGGHHQGGGGHGQHGGHGGHAQRHRPEIYTNDPGVEEFADENEPQPVGGGTGGGNAPRRDDRRDDNRGRDDRRDDRHRQHGGGGGQQHRGHQGGGQFRDDRNRDDRDRGGEFRRDDRNRGGGDFRRGDGPRGDRQPQPPFRAPQPQRDRGGDDFGDRPEPGNSIHGPETHVQSRTDAGKRGGRRGRGRGGKGPRRDPLEGKIPEITPDSLVARFLEEPVPAGHNEDIHDDDFGNRDEPRGGENRGDDRNAPQGGGGGENFGGEGGEGGGRRRRRRRRRGGRNRNRNRDEFGNELPPGQQQGGPNAPESFAGDDEGDERDEGAEDSFEQDEVTTPPAREPEPVAAFEDESADDESADESADESDDESADESTEAEAEAEEAAPTTSRRKTAKKAVKKTAKKTAKKAAPKAAKKAVKAVKKTAKKSTRRASGREVVKDAPAPIAESSVAPTGSSDRHQIDDDDAVELPDVSQFLTKPTSPADLDIIPDYDDDE